ncbi:MAG: hypothetical protein JWO82_1662 [Akkermansiaceae bacterium]|nr:hypothetical protein [Akkermansiaceae bacterium]
MDLTTLPEAALALAEKYGIEIDISYKGRPSTTPFPDANNYFVMGGEYSAKDPRNEAFCVSGSTLAEAVEAFIEKKDARLTIDPLDSLRKQAAEAGMELVPAGRPLDLETSTAAQG